MSAAVPGLMTPGAMASEVHSGMRLALPVDYAGVPMALMPHLVAGGARDLEIPIGSRDPAMWTLRDGRRHRAVRGPGG